MDAIWCDVAIQILSFIFGVGVGFMIRIFSEKWQR